MVAENNIKSVKQKVGVNLLHTNEFAGGTSDTGIDFTTENGIIRATGKKSIADSYRNVACDDFKASSQYYVVATTTGSPRISIRVFGYKNGSYTQLIDTAGTAVFNTGDYESILTRVVVGGSVNDTVNASISAMIISKEDYDAGLTDFQPYGAPNYDLTMLEAEDRAGIVDVIDSGAKNLFQVTGTATSGPGVTLTWNYSEGYITVNGTSAPSGSTPAIYLSLGSWTVPKDGYYVIASVNANSQDILIYNDQTWATWETQTWNPVRYFTKGTTMTIFLRITAGTVCNNLKVYPMICTKAAFSVSPKFVPYAKSNYSLTQYTDGLALEQTATGSGSLDNIRTTSYKMVSGNVSGFPSGESGYAFVKTMSYNNDNAVSQEITMVNNAHTYIRTFSNQQWTSWIKLGGGD